jgi:hypothetical protein
MQHLPIHPFLRHPLTGKPLQAVGIGRRGPIWPVIGSSEDEPGGDDAADSPDETPDDEGDDSKPEEHRQATREAAKFRRELKPWKDLSRELGVTPEQVREALTKAKQSDDGSDAPDVDEIRRQAALEARQQSDARLIRAEVRALAAETFAKPTDALFNLSLDEYEVDDDGELVDVQRVRADLARVLKENPHYAKSGKAPKADRSQGTKGDPPKADPGPGAARLRQAYADIHQQ